MYYCNCSTGPPTHTTYNVSPAWLRSQSVSSSVAMLQAWIGFESRHTAPPLLVSSGRPSQGEVRRWHHCRAST